jgi:hypothetical protein
MITEDLEDLIDQAELKEACPCGHGLSFGSCCGAFFSCDCKSKLFAVECCYQPLEEEKAG